MKTITLDEARATFTDLLDRAMSGEPSRVARGNDAVVIVSEADWNARRLPAPSLGHLLAQFADDGLLRDDVANRPWKERPLGRDFE